MYTYVHTYIQSWPIQTAIINITIDWVAYKQQKFISHRSRGWKSEIRVPEGSGSGEGPLLDCCLLVSSCGRKRLRELSRVSFIRALIPFMWAPPS